MLPHKADANVQGAKTSRMEQRITPQTKELIEQAATLLGINPSEFVISAAAKMARETVQGYGQTVLPASAHKAFMQAFDATEPAPRLRDLMRLHADVTAPK